MDVVGSGHCLTEGNLGVFILPNDTPGYRLHNRQTHTGETSQNQNLPVLV